LLCQWSFGQIVNVPWVRTGERDLVKCFVRIIREHKAGRQPAVHSEVLEFIETGVLKKGGPCSC